MKLPSDIPWAVGRDGTEKSRAKSGLARVYNCAETSLSEHSFNGIVLERIEIHFSDWVEICGVVLLPPNQ